MDSIFSVRWLVRNLSRLFTDPSCGSLALSTARWGHKNNLLRPPSPSAIPPPFRYGGSCLVHEKFLFAWLGDCHFLVHWFIFLLSFLLLLLSIIITIYFSFFSFSYPSLHITDFILFLFFLFLLLFHTNHHSLFWIWYLPYNYSSSSILAHLSIYVPPISTFELYTSIVCIVLRCAVMWTCVT